MKIGVFDSGVGGKSVANAVQKALPDAEVLLREDKQHLPYGTKTPDEIHGYVLPLIKELEDAGCAAVVVACNTVSTNLIEPLRKEVDVPLIAMEPMIKPATEATKSGVIAVCATPATLASARYKWLKDTYAKNIKVVEPDCSDWAQMIETNQIDHQKIGERLNQALAAGADEIVLGCTHYHWIEDDIKNLVVGKAEVLQPEKPVIEQLKRVLKLPS